MKVMASRLSLRKHRALAWCALVILAPVATASASRTVARPPLRATVVIRDIAFTPGTVTVRRGGWVTWSWRDGVAPNAIAHTVTSTGSEHFRGSGARVRGVLRVRFAHAGYYRYLCTIHLGMAGRVVVR